MTALVGLAAEAPPKLRLPEDIRPLKYAVDLTFVPGAADFSGTTDIEVTLSRPASVIWLNALEIAISEARVTAGTAGKNHVSVRIVTPKGKAY